MGESKCHRGKMIPAPGWQNDSGPAIRELWWVSGDLETAATHDVSGLGLWGPVLASSGDTSFDLGVYRSWCTTRREALTIYPRTNHRGRLPPPRGSRMRTMSNALPRPVALVWMTFCHWSHRRTSFFRSFCFFFGSCRNASSLSVFFRHPEGRGPCEYQGRLRTTW